MRPEPFALSGWTPEHLLYSLKRPMLSQDLKMLQSASSPSGALYKAGMSIFRLQNLPQSPRRPLPPSDVIKRANKSMSISPPSSFCRPTTNTFSDQYLSSKIAPPSVTNLAATVPTMFIHMAWPEPSLPSSASIICGTGLWHSDPSLLYPSLRTAIEFESVVPCPSFSFASPDIPRLSTARHHHTAQEFASEKSWVCFAFIREGYHNLRCASLSSCNETLAASGSIAMSRTRERTRSRHGRDHTTGHLVEQSKYRARLFRAENAGASMALHGFGRSIWHVKVWHSCFSRIRGLA